MGCGVILVKQLSSLNQENSGRPDMNNTFKRKERSKHELLYKMKSPSWRTAYTERCRERIKNDRAKNFNKLRCFNECEDDCDLDNASSVPGIMENELDAMMACSIPQDMNIDVSISSSPDSCYGSDEEIQNIMDGIERELREEEERLVTMYEYDAQFDNLKLQDMVDRLTGFQFICPVCQKFQLSLNNCIASCCCGLQVKVPADVDLKAMHTNILHFLEIHSNICDGSIQFNTLSSHEGTHIAVLGNCLKCAYNFPAIGMLF